MKLFWGTLALFTLVLTSVEAQSTWRGQAELWTSAAADGFFAASNEFPRNTVLNVENYKTQKSIQVRVVSPLPGGATALLLLSPKAAAALEVQKGDSTLVGVQIDNSIDSFKAVAGDDRPVNPDPDLNPAAGSTADAPIPAVPAPALAVAPVAPDISDSTPSDVLPADTPQPQAAPQLTLAPDTEAAPAVTPGRRVFLPPPDSAAPVATTTAPLDAAPAVASAPDSSSAATDVPVAPEPKPASAVASAPAAAPVAAVPAVTPTAPLAALPVLKPDAQVSQAYVSAPAKLQGPILGTVGLVSQLEKGKPYVQIASYSDERALMSSLDKLRSVVPVAVWYNPAEKNPYRLIVPNASNAQLGVLLMQYKSQGYRYATVIKG